MLNLPKEETVYSVGTIYSTTTRGIKKKKKKAREKKGGIFWRVPSCDGEKERNHLI